jgi:tRNA pseudouridine55 synthase
MNWNPPKGKFSLSCSKGTYVRTVLHDLGQNLGCGAHLTGLRRTKIDQFGIENAPPLEEIENMGHSEFQNMLIPIREAVPTHVL